MVRNSRVLFPGSTSRSCIPWCVPLPETQITFMKCHCSITLHFKIKSSSNAIIFSCTKPLEAAGGLLSRLECDFAVFGAASVLKFPGSFTVQSNPICRRLFHTLKSYYIFCQWIPCQWASHFNHIASPISSQFDLFFANFQCDFGMSEISKQQHPIAELMSH